MRALPRPRSCATLTQYLTRRAATLITDEKIRAAFRWFCSDGRALTREEFEQAVRALASDDTSSKNIGLIFRRRTKASEMTLAAFQVVIHDWDAHAARAARRSQVPFEVTQFVREGVTVLLAIALLVITMMLRRNVFALFMFNHSVARGLEEPAFRPATQLHFHDIATASEWQEVRYARCSLTASRQRPLTRFTAQWTHAVGGSLLAGFANTSSLRSAFSLVGFVRYMQYRTPDLPQCFRDITLPACENLVDERARNELQRLLGPRCRAHARAVVVRTTQSLIQSSCRLGKYEQGYSTLALPHGDLRGEGHVLKLNMSAATMPLVELLGAIHVRSQPCTPASAP